MVKASEVVYKYYEVGFAVKHKKDGFKVGFVVVLLAITFVGYFFMFLRNSVLKSDFYRRFRAVLALMAIL